jgi:hypothetical protein
VLLLLPLFLYLLVFTGRPLLSCVLLSVVVLRAIDALRIFGLPLLLTGKSLPEGSPASRAGTGVHAVLNVTARTEDAGLDPGGPSYRTDAYGTLQDWQAPYFAAVRQALTSALPRPQVPHGGEVERALVGVFREIVYEGRAGQTTLERYYQQLQQAWQRSK